MCMLLGMSKQLVYAFPGFYNKETIFSNIIKVFNFKKNLIDIFYCFLKYLDLSNQINNLIQHQGFNLPINY